MKSFWTIGTLLLLIAAAAGDSDVKPAPKANDIIDLCGGRLSKVFARFGSPEDVYVTRGSKPEFDKVSLSYGTYALQVRDKTVHSILFFASWPSTVKGVKIKDSREDVERILGNKHKTEKSSINVEDYGYELKDADATLWTDFDAENHVRMIEIQLN